MQLASSTLERHGRKTFKIYVSVPIFKNKQGKGNEQMYMKHILTPLDLGMLSKSARHQGLGDLLCSTFKSIYQALCA